MAGLFSGQLPPQDQIRGTETTIDLNMAPPPDITSGATALGSGFTPYELEPTEARQVSTNFKSSPDYSIAEGLLAGFNDTAVKALWHGFDTPDFEYDPTFNATQAVEYLKKSQGRVFTADQTAKLMRTGSSEEFNHQLTRFDESDVNSAVAGQELVGYLLGSLLDYDTLIPFGLGKATKLPKFRQIGRLKRGVVMGGGAGAAGYASFEADKYTHMSSKDVAIHISIMTAAGLLPELFKTSKLPTRQADKDVPDPTVDTSINITDLPLRE